MRLTATPTTLPQLLGRKLYLPQKMEIEGVRPVLQRFGSELLKLNCSIKKRFMFNDGQ